MSKIELVKHIAEKLHSYGFNVYLSKNKEYGFYTNSKKVVSFGGSWCFSLDFSGNYKPIIGSGSGWSIARELSDITEKQAHAFINATAPDWTGNRNPIYTTPDQHLAIYGKSSGYFKFEPSKVTP
jgi:hypothetical protein